MSSVSDQINKSNVYSLLSSQSKEPPNNIAFHCSINDSSDKALVNETTKNTNVMCMSSTTSITSLVWNWRLGHPSSQTLQQVLNTRIKCSDEVQKSQRCTMCKMGKTHKLPFSSFDTVYISPLQLVQVNIWGPAPIRSNGSKYYISFAHTPSRFTWVYFLANKMLCNFCFNIISIVC